MNCSKITYFFYFILFLSLLPSPLHAQSDSLFNKDGSLNEHFEFEKDDYILTQPDYEPLQVRRFDSTRLASYLDDRAFSYAKTKSKKKESSWLSDLNKSIKEAFRKLFSGLGLEKNIGRIGDVLMYTLAIFAFIIIIWGLLKLRAKDLFWRNPEPLDNIDFTSIETKIQEINFAELIEQAFKNQDYRMCVRWMYLETLKLLHNNAWIVWQSYKTNYEYYAELDNTIHKNDFLAITRQFEYIFYGNHSLNMDSFMQTQQAFLAFQQKINKKN